MLCLLCGDKAASRIEIKTPAAASITTAGAGGYLNQILLMRTQRFALHKVFRA